jgi:hypothetical protein
MYHQQQSAGERRKFMAKETIKATIAIKASSMRELVEALQNIADEASMQIVQRASVSTSIAIEADDIDDLRDALGAITGALSSSDEVECKVSAPGAVWHGRRLDPTPMERYINSAPALFP